MKLLRTTTLFFTIIIILTGCINPKELSVEEIADSALTDVQQIYAKQEPIKGVLGLGEAMARSLKYNLNNRVKLMEQAVARQSVEMAKLDMLPMLGVSAGYLDRSNVDASESVSIFTGRQSLEPSTSQDRKRYTADVRFTWNLLDFGVSYFQAKQNADRFLISQKAREKVMLKLLQQVRSAYWRAVIMQKMEKKVKSFLKNVNVTLNDLKVIREQQLYTPLLALNDIRLLVETRNQLEKLKASIVIANIELATLINSPSKIKLILKSPKKFEVAPIISDKIEKMELTALINSSDYTTEIYNVRIDQLESRKALTRLLPGIEFSYAGNYTSNSFLWNSLWGELGLRLAGDLLKLATIPDILAYAEISKTLANSRRLAVNTAVIAGVHLSWQDYMNRVDQLKQSVFLHKVDTEIAELTRIAEQNRSGSEVEAIQSEFKAINSKLAHLLAYAQVQESFGAFLMSLGSNPVPDNYQSLSVKKLAAVLKVKYKRWDKGDLDILTPEYMKKRIALKKKKEAQRSWWGKLLDEPVSMPPLKYTILSLPKLNKDDKDDKDVKKPKAKKITSKIMNIDSSYQNGYFVVE